MTKFLPKIMPRGQGQKQAEAYRQFLSKQAKMGGKLFGEIPAGHRREFFCLDKRTWVWHEEWLDQAGQRQSITTRYDIKAQGILKSQGVSSYVSLSDDELKNFYKAMLLYRDNLYTQMQQYTHA